jgi:long-subunit acyl-CoA synthetase (AMP-forming)
MLEFALLNAFILLGTTIGFGTSSISYLLPYPFSKLNSSCPGDIESFGPSILFGVPPWWDSVHEHALKELFSRPQQFRDGFWRAISRKKFLVENGVSSLPVMAIEKTGGIKEIRELFFGKRMRWVGVSCSAEAKEKREFLGLLFGSSGKMVQGWSLMEMSTWVSVFAIRKRRVNIDLPLR